MDKEDSYLYRLENHKPLRFGTAGLRDEDSMLTDMQIYISTKGFLNYLLNNSETEKGIKVALSGDFRPSTPRILLAVAAGIIDSSCEVEYCGKIPTPAVALFGFSNKIPSVMVTASHNPYGQNGVKFMKPDGEVLKFEEKMILDKISKIREEEYKKSWDESMFTKEGFFKKFEDMNVVQQFLYYSAKKSSKKINNFAKELYIERYKKAFSRILEGEKLVFYEQTSVGRDIIPKVFEELGAEVIRVEKIDETKEFIPIDTEDMKPSILDKMANLAYENHCNICLTADGDADRPALLYLKKDESGSVEYKDGKPAFEFIKGDKLNVIATLLLKPDFVAVPIHINHRAYQVMLDNGVEVMLTRVGSPHVIKVLTDKQKQNKNLKLYGFEANGGGIIFSSHYIPGIGEIRPLPTRDPILPVICAMVLAKQKKLDISGLVKEVFSEKYFSHCHSALVENISGKITGGLERYSSEIGIKIVDSIKPLKEEIVEIDFENELIFKNENSDEIIVEEEIVEHILRLKNILFSYVSEIFEGKHEIIRINFLDGIKIYLSNGEIVHFRPSKNAAQFRIYLESHDEERAVKLVEKAIMPCSGVLVRFINDFIDGKINIYK